MKRFKLKVVIKEFRGKHFFLSNFSPHRVFDYPTNEHYFQAQKTKSLEIKKLIKNQSSPKEAKRLGNQIELRPEWKEDEFKICAMYKGLKIKFSDPELKQKLLETGDAILEEGNYWHDNFWGNCFCSRCKEIRGKNYLGRLLMKLREELK